MEGKGQMVTNRGRVINGIYSYGVVNQDLTNKNLGCLDSLTMRIDQYTRQILTKLQSYQLYQVVGEYS